LRHSQAFSYEKHNFLHNQAGGVFFRDCDSSRFSFLFDAGIWLRNYFA